MRNISAFKIKNRIVTDINEYASHRAINWNCINSRNKNQWTNYVAQILRLIKAIFFSLIRKISRVIRLT